jgi:hypothetical protein
MERQNTEPLLPGIIYSAIYNKPEVEASGIRDRERKQ